MPAELTDQAIDAAILASVGPRSLKVAMVIARTSDRLADQGTIKGDQRLSDTVGEAVALRIQALVQQGVLEGFGLLDRWRHSEVRRASNGD